MKNIIFLLFAMATIISCQKNEILIQTPLGIYGGTEISLTGERAVYITSNNSEYILDQDTIWHFVYYETVIISVDEVNTEASVWFQDISELEYYSKENTSFSFEVYCNEKVEIFTDTMTKNTILKFKKV